MVKVTTTVAGPDEPPTGVLSVEGTRLETYPGTEVVGEPAGANNPVGVEIGPEDRLVGVSVAEFVHAPHRVIVRVTTMVASPGEAGLGVPAG